MAALVLWAAAARGGEPEPVGPATSDAVTLCHEADQVSGAERSAVLARGLSRAEEAVRANPRDAVAHFAVFCNLGKRLDMRRTVALDPDDTRMRLMLANVAQAAGER